MSLYVTQQIIGPYVVGEIPKAVQPTFTDSAGNALNLTGFTAACRISRLSGETWTAISPSGTASIPTPASGIAQYTWAEADLATAGYYRMVIWVGDGTNRYASEFFEYQIEDSQTTTPSI